MICGEIAPQLTARNGPQAAAAHFVDRLRDDLLAGAAFAGDEHRCAGRCHAAQLIVEPLHRRRAADEPAEVAERAQFLRRSLTSAERSGGRATRDSTPRSCARLIGFSR